MFIYGGKINFMLHGSLHWGDFWVSAVYVPMQKASPPFTLDKTRFPEHLLWAKHSAEHTKVNQALYPIWWFLLEQVLELSCHCVSRGKSLFLSVGFKVGMSLLTSQALCLSSVSLALHCQDVFLMPVNANRVDQWNTSKATRNHNLLLLDYEEMSVVERLDGTQAVVLVWLGPFLRMVLLEGPQDTFSSFPLHIECGLIPNQVLGT